MVDIDPPAALDASLVDLSVEPEALDMLEVSFEPSPEAEAHLLRFDDGSEPVRVEPGDCSEDRCQVLLDPLTVGDAVSATASAVAGGQESPPSDAVQLPLWPHPDEPPEDGPVTLVVTRLGDDGSLVNETEVVEPGADIPGRIEDLMATGDVVKVEIDAAMRPLQGQEDEPLPSYPDGLTTWQQEAFDFASLPESRGDGVTIAVIDSGVDPSHPALAGADIETVNVVEPGAEVAPDPHGTGVTSLIVGDAATGRVPGIAADAKVVAYDVWGGSSSEPARDDIAQAIHQAVDDGADVINVSLATSCSPIVILDVVVARRHCEPGSIRQAVEHAESQGVVVVAGAGNDGDGHSRCDDPANEDQWPAKFPTVIAVGGTDRTGGVWACSPDKDYIDVLAPAAKLLVARPSGSTTEGLDLGSHYAVLSGTSFSAPLVSGLIAVILAERPDLTPEQIRDLLARSTGEHGRLIPSIALGELGITSRYVDAYVIDTTTLRTVYPLTMEILLAPGHPLQAMAHQLMPEEGSPAAGEVAGLTGSVWDDLPRNASTAGASVKLTVEALLYVDDDGTIEGWGALERLHPGTQSSSAPGGATQVLTGHQVRCPHRPLGNAEALPAAAFAFYWDVPAVVGGQLDGDENGAELDLSVSLGLGTEPDARGELPGIRVTHDDLDRCARDLQAVWDDITTCGGHPTCRRDGPLWWDSAICRRDPDARLDAGGCWTEVQRARNTLVDDLEAFYEEIVASGPFQLTDFAQLSPDGNQYYIPSRHSDDELVSISLSLGDPTPSTWTRELDEQG